MKEFAKLFNASVITTFALAVIFSVGAVVIWCQGRELPPYMWTMLVVTVTLATGGKLSDLLAVLAGKLKSKTEDK